MRTTPMRLLLAAGLLAGGTAFLASPADAHTNAVNVTCDAVDVHLTNYQTKPGHPAVTHVVHHPGTPAVTHVEYLWSNPPGQGNSDNPGQGNEQGNEERWLPAGEDPPGNNKPGTPGAWVKIGERTVVDTPAVHGTDETVVDSPATAGDNQPNHVTVTVGGTVRADTAFGTSYSGSFAFPDRTKATTYKVVIVAWDDARYSRTYSGTSEPCVPPVVVVTPPVETEKPKPSEEPTPTETPKPTETPSTPAPSTPAPTTEAPTPTTPAPTVTPPPTVPSTPETPPTTSTPAPTTPSEPSTPTHTAVPSVPGTHAVAPKPHADTTPAPTRRVHARVHHQAKPARVLPNTGAGDNLWLLGGAGLVLLTAGGTVLVRSRNRA